MYINPWFILTITILFILWYLAVPPVSGNMENFGDYVGPKIHLQLDNYCAPIRYSYQQPSGDGIYGCTQVPCPEKYDEYVCWNCCNYH